MKRQSSGRKPRVTRKPRKNVGGRRPLVRRLSWQHFERRTKNLAGKIRAAGFQPDIIIGVIRGGLIPSRLIAKFLGVQSIQNIQVQKVGGKRQVLGRVPLNLKGKRVLLIEDMLETGRSLAVARDHLAKQGANVKTAAYYLLPQSEVTPDFFLFRLDKKVLFPWE